MFLRRERDEVFHFQQVRRDENTLNGNFNGRDVSVLRTYPVRHYFTYVRAAISLPFLFPTHTLLSRGKLRMRGIKRRRSRSGRFTRRKTIATISHVTEELLERNRETKSIRPTRVQL